MTKFTIFRNEERVDSYLAGHIIFAEGQPGDCMYAVLDGAIEIVRNGRVLNTLESGGVFGEMALIDQLPRSASAVAKTDCRVALISEHRFTVRVSHNPHFALEMMRLLSERVRDQMAS